MLTLVNRSHNLAISVVIYSLVIYNKFCAGTTKFCEPGFQYDRSIGFMSNSAQCEWLNNSDKDDGGLMQFPWKDNLAEERRKQDDIVASKLPQCTRIYLTDFGSEFVSDQDFVKIKEYIYHSIKSCVEEGIGHAVLVVPLMHEEKYQVCCNLEDCARMLLSMQKSDIVHPYNNTDLLWNKKSFLNTWYNEVDYMNSTLLSLKAYFGVSPCSKNSFVFISNRLMDMNQITKEGEIPRTYQYFRDMILFYCIRLTMIIVGRPELMDRQLDSQYVNITQNLFSVIDYNCLATELTDCLRPCGDEDFIQCRKKNLSKCRVPSPIPSPPARPVEKFTDDLHVVYVFALSQHTSEWSFFNILNAVRQPIFDYFHSGKELSIALIFPETPFNFTWIHDQNTLAEQMNVNHESGVLELELGEDLIDKTSQKTTNMLYVAAEKYLMFFPDFEDTDLAEMIPQARFVLITDFIAKNFIDTIRNDVSSNILDKFDFRVYASNQPTRHYYLMHSKFQTNLFDPSDADLRFALDDDEVPTPHKAETSREKLILFIAIVSFSASILILVACTFIYRRKLVWLQKLERFRAHHQGDEPNNSTDIIVTDFWELSWDKLLIKSEKLGSGAYGQVYRGTVIGKPPCAEHVYSSRPNSSFELDNCDVAVKILPRYASEAARQEFMFEIEIMKSMGYNENIVNMLGCITVGQTICLVLEFCPYKDLLNYVKVAKTDMETVNESEEKTDYSKDFLLFSWQISDGMRFLHSNGIIHRDLAARNILVDADRNAKICDFGLCVVTNYKSLPVSDSFGSQRNGKVSISGRLPIKWLAVECLKHKQFSPKSDVWSFGILLYEMYSFGSAPFENIQPPDLLEHLEEGKRPEKPYHCPDEIYTLMQKSWLEKPEDRPTFHELLTLFTIFLERATEGYGYLCLLKTNTQHYSQLSKLALAKSFRQENFERRRSRAATDRNLVVAHFKNNNTLQLPNTQE